MLLIRTARRPLPAYAARWVVLMAIAIPGCIAGGQAKPTVTQPAATDSSAQASPLTKAPVTPATDSSAEASPVSGIPAGTSIAANTLLTLRLQQAVRSGSVRNGDHVNALLTKPVHSANGHMIPAETTVTLTLLAVVTAGEISSAGEITLQVLRVGNIAVDTDALTFRGERGAKELPDSAPAKGKEVVLAAGTELSFHVMPPAKPATGPPSKPNIGTVQPAPQP